MTLKNKYKKPHIVRRKVKENPYGGEPYYYSIVYYDVFRGEYMEGYGSFNRDFVKQWLNEEFIAVTRLDLRDHANVNLFEDGNICENIETL